MYVLLDCRPFGRAEICDIKISAKVALFVQLVIYVLYSMILVNYYHDTLDFLPKLLHFINIFICMEQEMYP